MAVARRGSCAHDPSPLDEFAERRSKATDELLEKAQSFFAMKSTGAEIVVPIFNDADFGDALAA